MTKLLLVSVVISAYTLSRLEDILELLDSIRAQSYPRIETIVVVEKSKVLFNYVKEYSEKSTPPAAKVIFNSSAETGLSAARNIGIKEAKGDIIAFVDDDSLPFPDWAEQMVKTYEDGSVIGATGPILPLWEDGEIPWFPREFDWILSCSGFSGITRLAEVRNVYGTNMSFRREALEKAGMFLTNLGARGGGETGKHELVGDETELSLRVREKTGKRILFNPQVRVRHRVYKYRVDSAFIARRAYWEGYTKAMFQLTCRWSGDKKLLKVEYGLLRRIFTGLFPCIFRDFFVNPVVAWRRLSVAVVALLFVALGYSDYLSRTAIAIRKQ